MNELALVFTGETKTKHGIDKLELMIRFIRVIEGKQSKEEFSLFKLWIRSKLKRNLSDQEELNLTTGVYNYIISNAETKARLDSMNYLFNAEFLLDTQNDKCDA